MKRQMETLTTILHEPMNEQRMACDANVIRDGIATEPDNQRNRDEGIPSVRGQIYRKRNSGVGNQPLGEHDHEMRGQFCSRQNLGNDNRGVNAEESELRQHQYNIEQERDQVAARDLGRAMELEGEVWRLAHIMDEM